MYEIAKELIESIQKEEKGVYSHILTDKWFLTGFGLFQALSE